MPPHQRGHRLGHGARDVGVSAGLLVSAMAGVAAGRILHMAATVRHRQLGSRPIPQIRKRG
jgi:hypothetical protein